MPGSIAAIVDEMIPARFRWSILVALAFGCGGPPVQSRPLDSVQPAGSSISEAVTLTGRLLGHDGKPMRLAHVHTGGSSRLVDAEGRFEIEVDQPFARVGFTGVDHSELWLGIATAEGSVKLDVQLGTYARQSSLDQISVATYKVPVGEGQVPRPNGVVPMKKVSDGVFTAEIASPDDQIGYHLVNLAVNRSVNGPQADSFVYDNGGDYLSVVGLEGGKATVTLDTSRLVPANETQSVAFAKPESTAARVAGVFLNNAYDGYGGENNEWVRSAKLLAFLNGQHAAEKPETMIEVAGRVVKEIPSESPLWQMAPGAVLAVASSAEGGMEYAEKVARSLQDPNQAAQIVMSLLFLADRNGDVKALERLTEFLKSELGDTPFARQAQMFDPTRKVMVGKPLPAFDYEEWGGARHITDKTFHGKQVVIKFWATWCKPCIAEMDHLHEMWDAKKDSDFVLLSININDSAEAFEKFRKKWPMPWPQIVLDSEQSARAMGTWEIIGIPKSITADKDGIIQDVKLGGSIQ